MEDNGKMAQDLPYSEPHKSFLCIFLLSFFEEGKLAIREFLLLFVITASLNYIIASFTPYGLTLFLDLI